MEVFWGALVLPLLHRAPLLYMPVTLLYVSYSFSFCGGGGVCVLLGGGGLSGDPAAGNGTTEEDVLWHVGGGVHAHEEQEQVQLDTEKGQSFDLVGRSVYGRNLT